MITKSSFKAAWWLPGPHLQTLWPSLMRAAVSLKTDRERLNLPDGDFIDLDWVELGADTPLVIVLHGLEGSIESAYARGILRALKEQGLSTVFMHFRGCSGEHNRFARAYHSGETEDIAYLVSLIQSRFPDRRLGGLGYSLGGNVLLKWLGESGADNPLCCAVAVSVPFLLNRLADTMSRGFARLYQWYLVRQLQKKFYQKASLVESHIDLGQAKDLNSFWKFDEKITAPLHGFASASDYYQKSSCRQYLKGIESPTLIIHALDDPFMVPDVVPSEGELAEKVSLELSQTGGHVGFITGNIPGYAEYWLEERIPQYFVAQLLGL